MSPPVIPRYHHSVQLYEESDAHVRTVGAFVAEGLAAGQPAIVVATARHREGIINDLYTRLINCDKAIQAGQLSMLDAAETLRLIMVDDAPDPGRFEKAFSAAIEHVQQRHGHVPIRVYGEMVDLVCARGLTTAALQLEMLGNKLSMQYDVGILCGYARGRFEESSAFLRDVCSLHSHVVESDSAPFAKSR